MATTTPNYGWAVPTSTDLVKDGATAIETLGDAIDASMNTALGTKKAGMVLLNTTSFSAVASQSVNDVFSTNYRYYRIIVDLTAYTADLDLRLRYRVSGADNSANEYYQGGPITNWAGTLSNISQNGVSGHFISGGDSAFSGHYAFTDLTIYRPFETVLTGITGNLSYVTSTGTNFGGSFAGIVNNAASYTGFSLVPTAGNITGSVQTYGFNQ
jgi:hypothetical protein